MANRYKTVESKVCAVARLLGDVTYLYMNWSQANDAIDNIDNPSVVYVLPPSGTLDFGFSRVKDSPTTQIAFLAPSDFDFDGEDNEDVVEHMKRIAVRFVKAINESEFFETIEGDVQYRTVYDYLDRNVTGVMLELTLKDSDGINFCDIGTYRDGETKPIVVIGYGGSTMHTKYDMTSLDGFTCIESQTFDGTYMVTNEEKGYLWVCGEGLLGKVIKEGFEVPMEERVIIDGMNCYRSTGYIEEIGENEIVLEDKDIDSGYFDSPYNIIIGFGSESLDGFTDFLGLKVKATNEADDITGTYEVECTETGDYLWFCSVKEIKRVTASGFLVPLEPKVVVGKFNCYRTCGRIMEEGSDEFDVTSVK